MNDVDIKNNYLYDDIIMKICFEFSMALQVFLEKNASINTMFVILFITWKHYQVIFGDVRRFFVIFFTPTILKF